MSDNIERVDGVIINTNDDEYKRFIQIRNRAIKEKELQSQIDDLKEEVKNIKNHLREIINRLS